MVRIVKDPEVRRNEILDVAQGLFYRKGYKQTSIQDIITEIGIAKGTFYHYFSSKLALLDEMIERMIAEIVESLQVLVADEQASALEKFNQYFARAESWKVGYKTFLLDILRSWYSDDNAIFRDKIKAASMKDVIPALTKIINQGIEEGSFDVPDDPAEIAEIVMSIGQHFADAISYLLLNAAEDKDCLKRVERKVLANQYAIERVLNAPSGSIKIFDIERTKHWFD